MPLQINTNLPALNARRILSNTGRDLTKRIERLSSGLRVNRASDDAAGLSISEGIRAEVSGFTQGIKNSEHATNLIQTAEGALGEMNNILLRMRELSVQSASSTVNDNNRTAANAELGQLVNEIDRIANATSYNNTSLLSGFGNVVNRDVAVSTALAS
jgi:flagellin